MNKSEIIKILSQHEETAHRNVGHGCNNESYILPFSYDSIAEALLNIKETEQIMQEEDHDEYWKPISDRPKNVGKYLVKTKDGKLTFFIYTGSDISFISMRDQYEMYLDKTVTGKDVILKHSCPCCGRHTLALSDDTLICLNKGCSYKKGF